ncbi:hypothetical protein TWF694_000178 [Orbilia ellipsospora]|uniref:F-box domain-containing protein n=1 Tax=Orbilia ellipsospora TaxID=2528407 RepID=A0AAV9XP87_9PEZI
MGLPNIFAKLPLELLQDICLELDIPSLKAFKIASIEPKTHAAANAILYETLTIRLGTLEWDRTTAQSRIRYIDNIMVANGDDRPDIDAINSAFLEYPEPGLFPFVKTLVVDTRFPFTVTKAKCIERHKAIEALESGAIHYETEVAPYEELITEYEQTAIVQILRTIIALAEKLKVVRWRGSDAMPLGIHREMCHIICSPLQKRHFELDISFTIRTDKVDKTYYKYLAAISYPQHLSLMIYGTRVDPSRGLVLTLEDLHEFATLVERTQNLKTFEFFNENLVFSIHFDIDRWPKTMDGGEIGAALAKIETLEAVAGNINLGIPSKFDWTKTQKLTRVGSTYKYGGSCFFADHSGAMYDSLHDAGIVLDKFSVGTYYRSKDYLLRHEPVLTDLELSFVREWPDKSYGLEIWEEIVPRFAKTLKHLKVWSWYTYTQELTWHPGGSAQKALQECQKLEDLAICSVFRDQCFTTEMVEDILTFCPKLGRIDIKLSLEHAKKNIQATVEKLADWESNNNAFAGRSLLLTYQDREGNFHLPKKLAVGYIPPLWYDYLLQSYRLAEYEGSDAGHATFKLERQNDIFLLNDNLIRQFIRYKPKYDLDD